MGLAQRRIVTEFQQNVFPEWKKSFDAIVGFEIPFDVKWDTLTNDDYDKKEQYFEWWPMVYFKPLTDAFTSLCSDQMGKDAVKSSVKSIVIDGSEGSSPNASSFENGVLTIQHKPQTNVDDIDARAKAWTKLVESKL